MSTFIILNINVCRGESTEGTTPRKLAVHAGVMGLWVFTFFFGFIRSSYIAFIPFGEERQYFKALRNHSSPVDEF